MGDGAAAVLFDQSSRLLEIFARCEGVVDLRQRLTDIDQNEVGAFLGEPHGMAAAHPARGAGNKYALAAYPSG